MRSAKLKNPSSNNCSKNPACKKNGQQKRRAGMTQQQNLAGSFTLPGTSLTVKRMGYGAMQLAGRDGDKLVWGKSI